MTALDSSSDGGVAVSDGGNLYAWLGRTLDSAVDPAPAFGAVMAAVAPSAEARVLDWRTGG